MIYQHQIDTSRVLVAPFVAAQMTDLLQTAVNTGTARAAQIGRPVAGKTGTTTSNKDGWFLGFSSGITTGVWMGRDDARPIPGLQGGTAPARAFAAFMRRAVARRPVEPFDTQVTLPEWQLEPDDESYFGSPDNGAMMVDPDGNPLPVPSQPGDDGYMPDEPPRAIPPAGTVPAQPGAAQRDGERLDQDWLDRVTGRDAPPTRPLPQRDRDPDRLPRRDEPRDQDSRPNQ